MFIYIFYRKLYRNADPIATVTANSINAKLWQMFNCLRSGHKRGEITAKDNKYRSILTSFINSIVKYILPTTKQDLMNLNRAAYNNPAFVEKLSRKIFTFLFSDKAQVMVEYDALAPDVSIDYPQLSKLENVPADYKIEELQIHELGLNYNNYT